MKSRHLTSVVLAACLTLQPMALTKAYAEDGSLIALPKSINNLYSNIDMKVSLATKKNMAPCEADACVVNRAFDERVQLIGQKLAVAAFDLFPQIEQRIAYFHFNVADKEGAGTASNAEGNIVIFRGLQNLNLNDEALGFIIAREMGHVIGQHHRKNSSTRLIISALASFIFPVAGIIGASSSTAAQASSASTVVTSAASTATSYIGSKVAMISVKPSQLAESDAIAKSLLVSQSRDLHFVVSGLPTQEASASGWLKDLQTSKINLNQQLQIQTTTVALVEPK